MTSPSASLQATAGQLAAVLDATAIREALASMFRDGCDVPVRHHHTISNGTAPDATLLLMPAWQRGRYLGVKVVNVFPGNGAIGLPAVQGTYLLFDGGTGVLLAMLDGNELTARRTAAASALAASYLAAPDADSLLVVGTGRLSAHLARAHAAVRPLARIGIWGRDPAKAAEVAATLQAEGLPAMAEAGLQAAVGAARIVSCATLSREPLVLGNWLRPGMHLDLVGGFTPEMRETDDEAVRRASVFVDAPGALTEAGDIVLPMRSGALAPDGIRGNLAALARGEHPGRRTADEITLFKSVGTAEEDLAAAILAYDRLRAGA
jgi:ornithine cyclodeaminase